MMLLSRLNLNRRGRSTCSGRFVTTERHPLNRRLLSSLEAAPFGSATEVSFYFYECHDFKPSPLLASVILVTLHRCKSFLSDSTASGGTKCSRHRATKAVIDWCSKIRRASAANPRWQDRTSSRCSACQPSGHV